MSKLLQKNLNEKKVKEVLKNELADAFGLQCNNIKKYIDESEDIFDYKTMCGAISAVVIIQEMIKEALEFACINVIDTFDTNETDVHDEALNMLGEMMSNIKNELAKQTNIWIVFINASNKAPFASKDDVYRFIIDEIKEIQTYL